MLITLSSFLEPRYLGSLASVANEQHMQWLWDFSRRKPFWIGKYISCLSPLKITVPVHLGKQKLLQLFQPHFQMWHCPQLSAAFAIAEQGIKLKVIIYLANFISLYQKEEFIVLPTAGLFLPWNLPRSNTSWENKFWWSSYCFVNLTFLLTVTSLISNLSFF